MKHTYGMVTVTVKPGKKVEPSVLEAIAMLADHEAREIVACSMKLAVYGGECDCEPRIQCWGHTHGKHWVLYSESE